MNESLVKCKPISFIIIQSKGQHTGRQYQRKQIYNPYKTEGPNKKQTNTNKQTRFTQEQETKSTALVNSTRFQ